MSETRTVDVMGPDGSKAGTAELPADLFDVQTNIPLIHQVVVAQQAAARQGTHATKTRGDVRGGGKKPWRQKGTGRARQGSIRAPQWTGGGIVHGPQPRSYAQRTPKKMIAAAVRGVLSERARDGKIFVVESLVDGEAPSTKQALAMLARVGDPSKTLVVIGRDQDIEWLSLRNVEHVHVIVADQLNAYDILANEAVVFTRDALDAYVSGPTRGKSAKAVATEDEAEPIDEPMAVAPATLMAAPVEEPEAEVTEGPAAETEPAEAPVAYAGSFRGESKDGFDIKGNEDSMRYHTPQSPYYDATIAELWFDSVESAEAAGFSPVKGDAGAKEETK